MEFQFFGTDNSYLFSLRISNHISQLLLPHFTKSSYERAFSSPISDFIIEHQHIAQITSSIRSELEELLKLFTSESETMKAIETLSEKTVLQRRLLLDLRNPLHMTLLQVHNIYEKLNEAASQGIDLRVFIVPDLSSMDFHLLKFIKDASATIDLVQLRQGLKLEYDRIVALPILTAELLEVIKQDAEKIIAPGVLEQLISRLANWELLEVEQSSSTVRASIKLILIRL